METLQDEKLKVFIRQVVSVAFPMVGGLGVGFFGCLLSHAKKVKRQHGSSTHKSRCAVILATTGSFVFSLFSLIPLALGAPINIVNVVRAGSLLPSNAFFSQFFGLRPLTRDDYIGTLVTISGVACFIMFVGPPGHDLTQDQFLYQVSRPAPVMFNVFIMALMCGCAGWIAVGEHGHKTKLLALAVSIVISCSIAAMDIATKGWSAALKSSKKDVLESPLFWAAFLTQSCFFAISKWGMIYGCSRCDVLIFVPLNIVLNIFFAVAAGMVVLGEATQVPNLKSWFGLAVSWICVVVGILMLVSGPADRQDDIPPKLKKEDTQSDLGDTSEDADSPTEGSGMVHNRHNFTYILARLWRLSKWALFGRLFVGSAKALAKLNSAHISAARARIWWREQVNQVRDSAGGVAPDSPLSITSDDSTFDEDA